MYAGMESDAPMEGTIGALLHAQPVDTSPEDRKRSGRPCVGGRGELWEALTQLMLFETDSRTKNGLPGVPYAMKHTLMALKEVWTRYAPGVRLGVPPLDCVWLAASADAMVPAILTDVYLAPGECRRYLQALVDVTTVLSRRTSQEWITDAHAPRALFTPALISRYAQAVLEATPAPLHPTPCLAQHYVSWADVERLYGAAQEMLAGAVELKLGPDTVRALGWGRFVLALFMPVPGVDNGAPPHVTYGRDVLNQLRVAKPGSSSSSSSSAEAMDTEGEEEEGVPPPRACVFLACDVARKEAWLEVPGVVPSLPPRRVPLTGPATEAALWVWLQRESAVHGERLFPKRVTSDVILKRLSRAMPAHLHGRVLTSMGLHTAWVTHAFHDVLALLQARTQTLQLAGCDAPALLTTAVYPATVAALPRLCFPGDDVHADDLLRG
jgi:hypothetical protein